MGALTASLTERLTLGVRVLGSFVYVPASDS